MALAGGLGGCADVDPEQLKLCERLIPAIETEGARIEIVLATGRRTAYRVDSIQRFDRQALPEAVFGRSGPERLRLVTCTGPYLPEAGGYQQNLVITAVPD